MKCIVKGCKSERFTRKDGKVLERCYKHAKEWSEAFERALLSPQFIASIDKAVKANK